MFNTSSYGIHSAQYASNHNYAKDLLAINNNEVFCHSLDPSNGLLHFTKATFNISFGHMVEDFHITMPGSGTIYSAQAFVEQDRDNIWHAVASQGKGGYFQHNLQNFTLVGNKYATSSSLNIHGVL